MWPACVVCLYDSSCSACLHTCLYSAWPGWGGAWGGCCVWCCLQIGPSMRACGFIHVGEDMATHLACLHHRSILWKPVSKDALTDVFACLFRHGRGYGLLTTAGMPSTS